jgi:hypothetical protein
MLMNQGGREARVRYMAGTFRLLVHGDHVLCAVTGAPISLDQLRYWSVARQEAYADASASLEGERRAGEVGR